MNYPPPYMDFATLCEHLPWERDTVTEMVKRGQLPAGILIGRKYVWKWAAVEERMDVLLGQQPSEAALAERVRHATKRAVNAR